MVTTDFASIALRATLITITMWQMRLPKVALTTIKSIRMSHSCRTQSDSDHNHVNQDVADAAAKGGIGNPLDSRRELGGGIVAMRPMPKASAATYRRWQVQAAQAHRCSIDAVRSICLVSRMQLRRRGAGGSATSLPSLGTRGASANSEGIFMIGTSKTCQRSGASAQG